MKTFTLIVRSHLLILGLFLSVNSFAQDFNVQHLQDDVARTGGTNTSFTPVASINNAVALANNNRKVSAGVNGSGSTYSGDDLSGARVLTGTGTLSYYREGGSVNSNTRFNSSIWEYIGPSAGNNEMIVRGRYAVALNGGTNSVTQALSGITNADNCIPFITGIMNDGASQDADSGTALAYLENATTLRILKGSNANNVTVYITVVEFTGSNWTVLHGDSGSVSSDTGTLTLRNNSDGTGTATNVSAWSESVIFSHHIGDTGASGTNDAIADNWPVMDPGSNNQTVDWTFDGNHDSAGTNRHFVHVLTNTDLNVTRFQNTSNTAGESTINITSAGLTDINQALIVGSSRSSGGGAAYARGWRNYYLNSTTQAAHWSHRSGNTMAHEIQIIDLTALTSITGPEIDVVGNSNSINDGDTTPSVTDDTDFGSVNTAAGTNANTFTIDNLGTADLILNGGTAPFVTISGAHAGDFTITSTASSPIAASGNTTFEITFDPSANGTRTATVTINNNDSAPEDVYTFDIEGEGFTPAPEINVTGNGNNITDGDTSPSVTDDTDFGSILYTAGNIDNTFTIENTGTADLILNGGSAPFVTISGTHAVDFTIIAAASSPVSASGNTTFTIRFDPSAAGLRTASVIINNNDTTGGESLYNFNIQGTGLAPSYCTSNGNNSDGYNTGTRLVSFNTINNATPIEDNDYSDFTGISTTVTQGSSYNLTVNANTDGSYTTYTYAWIDWNQDFDFNDAGEAYSLGTAFNTTNGATILSPLSILVPVTATLGNTRMRVSTKYNSNPTNCETGFDGEVEDYTINIITSTPQPEINITGNGVTINDGDVTPTAVDDTYFGGTAAGTPITNTFTIQNTGTLPLSVGAITFGGAAPLDFTVNTAPPASIAAGSSGTFSIDFDPTGIGTRTATISIVNGDLSGENPYDFTIQGLSLIPLTEGPGGVTADLALWLKGTDGLGYTNGQSVSLWADQGRGADATVNTAGQEPTYQDNVNDNVNFNPVVDFDNTYSTFTLDSDFSYDDTSTQFLEGTSGYYSQDIFTVLIPDVDVDKSFGSMDIFCGDEDIATDNTDATGIGLGAYTVRFDDEVLTYCHGPTASGDGYGVAETDPGAVDTTYDNAGIINVRNNAGATQQELYYNAINKETTQNDVPDFANVNDARFWIGRSEGWEASTDARIAEVITFSSRKTDTDLTVERNRIMSYLAIKYGITLGVNGTSQDYVNSNGDLIWDVNTGVPADDVFNFDIAGIGRDDDSDLHQKQSRSVNNAIDGPARAQGVLTMGISTIYDTNKLNPSTDLEDKEFLVWGNDGVDLDDPAVVVDIDMSSGITPAIAGGTMVQFNGIARTWKVVENVPNPGVDDIPSVEVAILESAVRTATPPTGVYLMFISDSPNFGPTADYRVMSAGTNELGENILKTNYDFDGTKYITFGWAPERVYTRSVYFDGATDYIDMEDALDLNPTAFTISAWIKRDAADSGPASILSKRPTSFTQGYELRIINDNRVSFIHETGTTQRINSNTNIPDDEWHHVAVIYDGTQVDIYIDGVLDNSDTITAPVSTTDSFFVGAAGKNAPTQFFMGNIDEVRIWNTNLSESQLQYIMNQEIEDNSNFVGGSYFINKSITPTKDDIATMPWSDLAGYYPMTTYTYTNTKDESGNGNRGALRNLRTVDRQTAPLPYQSTTNGDWDTKGTWENGSMQTIPGARSIVDNNITVDWNIVETNHNVTMDNSSLPAAKNDNRQILALSVESNELELSGDNATNTGNGLTISHFLSIDGKIDLEGDSQLIQSTDSDLDVTSAGTLEKDQQGTQDYFTYNYWSSPVGVSNTTTNNNSYALNNNIFKDGSDASAPVNMNFVSGNNGANGTPISISTRWIYKFANLADDYYNWLAIGNTGSLLAGEGFTMKGVDDTGGSVSLIQNYTIEGKPNNGSITLPIANANDYLVGNPYSSAIDANIFIGDNTDTTGAIYLWEHFGGGTHVTTGYQGGYAVYNLSGGTPAIQYDFVTGGVDLSGGTGTKTPGRYIPVAQGFFVIGTATGTINFNNSQRIFRKEDATSVFVRSVDGSTTLSRTDEVDDRLKIRLSFEAPNTYKRQLLVTRDALATNQIDFGYDAVNKDELSNDMFWMIDNEKFVIQGTNTIDVSTILPIGIETTENGINTFKIDALENVPSDLQVYVHDKTLETYHNLRNSEFQIDLPAGEYLERFEITFTDQSLSVNDFEATNVEVYYSNDSNDVVINNPKNLDIDSVEIINMIGQVIMKYNNIESASTVKLKTKKLSVGAYIIKLKTEIGEISKKVLVK